MNTRAVVIQIVTGDARPIFKQIVDGIRLQVVNKEIEPGCKLPSVRALAQQLTINPNTVAKAYAELVSQGFLESRKGLGIFVAKRRQILSQQEQENRLGIAIDGFINEVAVLDFTPEEVGDRLGEKLLSVMKNRGSTQDKG